MKRNLIQSLLEVASAQRAYDAVIETLTVRAKIRPLRRKALVEAASRIR